MPPQDSERQDDASEDLRLIAASRGGDAGALGSLLTRHQARMYGLCLRVLRHRESAADACQDSMVKIIQGLPTFDERAKFTTWMTRVVLNVCLSKLRSEKVRRTTSLDAPAGGVGRDLEGECTLSRTIGQQREPAAGVRVQEKEGREALDAALGALDAEQRAILLLRDQRGLDYDEIGEVLGVAVGTVKSRLFRARGALRTELERLEGRDGDEA
jgi:RNA polymerase sigma-70 factor, ECF subfamily